MRTRHRKSLNALVNIVAGLTAYCLRIQKLEEKFEKVVDRVWVDYEAHSYSKAHPALGKDVSTQEKMNNVKVEAESIKAIEKEGRQYLASKISKIISIHEESNLKEFRAEKIYADLDQRKAANVARTEEPLIKRDLSNVDLGQLTAHKTSKLEGGQASVGLAVQRKPEQQAEQRQQAKSSNIEKAAASPAKASKPEIQLPPEDKRKAESAGKAIKEHMSDPHQDMDFLAAVSKDKNLRKAEQPKEASQGRGR